MLEDENWKHQPKHKTVFRNFFIISLSHIYIYIYIYILLILTNLRINKSNNDSYIYPAAYTWIISMICGRCKPCVAIKIMFWSLCCDWILKIGCTNCFATWYQAWLLTLTFLTHRYKMFWISLSWQNVIKEKFDKFKISVTCVYLVLLDFPT